MIDNKRYVSGDSYVLEMYIFEDEDKNIPQDLSTINRVIYQIINRHSDELIFKTEYNIDPEIVIADPTNGKITVDVRSDLNPQPTSQLYHKMEIWDESGRKTTILSENFMVEQYPTINN